MASIVFEAFHELQCSTGEIDLKPDKGMLTQHDRDVQRGVVADTYLSPAYRRYD